MVLNNEGNWRTNQFARTSQGSSRSLWFFRWSLLPNHSHLISVMFPLWGCELWNWIVRSSIHTRNPVVVFKPGGLQSGMGWRARMEDEKFKNNSLFRINHVNIYLCSCPAAGLTLWWWGPQWLASDQMDICLSYNAFTTLPDWTPVTPASNPAPCRHCSPRGNNMSDSTFGHSQSREQKAGNEIFSMWSVDNDPELCVIVTS